jgi:hypothetical protein
LLWISCNSFWSPKFGLSGVDKTLKYLWLHVISHNLKGRSILDKVVHPLLHILCLLQDTCDGCLQAKVSIFGCHYINCFAPSRIRLCFISIFLFILWKGTHLYYFYTIYCDTKLKSFKINIFTSHGGLLIIDKLQCHNP